MVLRTLKHRNMFFINYSHVWWRAIFNIHFSNPANFILFLYLDVFLWLNFVWMSICHLFQLLCHIIVIVYATHFRGHLEISALASWYQHWHWKILFSSYIFLKKIRYDQHNSCPHLHQYHFATITHFFMIFFSFIQMHPLVL